MWVTPWCDWDDSNDSNDPDGCPCAEPRCLIDLGPNYTSRWQLTPLLVFFNPIVGLKGLDRDLGRVTFGQPFSLPAPQTTKLPDCADVLAMRQRGLEEVPL